MNFEIKKENLPGFELHDFDNIIVDVGLYDDEWEVFTEQGIKFIYTFGHPGVCFEIEHQEDEFSDQQIVSIKRYVYNHQEEIEEEYQNQLNDSRSEKR